MKSCNIIIFSKATNLKHSQQQNENFLTDYSTEEKSAIRREQQQNNSVFFTPQKNISNKIPMALNDSKKALCAYAVAKGEKQLSAEITQQATQYMSFTKKSDQEYNPHCMLNISFEVDAPDSKEAILRYDFQLHYQTKLNGETLGLHSETEKLVALNEQELKNMQRDINKLQKLLPTTEEYKKLKNKIANQKNKDPVEAFDTQILDKLAIHKKYKPISFIISTRKLTGVNGHSNISQELLGENRLNLLNRDQMNNKDFYINKHCIYSEQLDFAFGTNTKDIIIDPALIQRNEESLADEKEEKDIQYRKRNIYAPLTITNATPQDEDETSCGCFAWFYELINMIDEFFASLFADENEPEPDPRMKL